MDGGGELRDRAAQDGGVVSGERGVDRGRDQRRVPAVDRLRTIATGRR